MSNYERAEISRLRDMLSGLEAELAATQERLRVTESARRLACEDIADHLALTIAADAAGLPTTFKASEAPTFVWALNIATIADRLADAAARVGVDTAPHFDTLARLCLELPARRRAALEAL